jgi:uncharacterized membrane protein
MLSVALNAVIILALLLTLSRGAYLGLGVFAVVLSLTAAKFRVNITRFTICLLVSFCIAFVAAIAIVPQMKCEYINIVSGKQSVSQLRSTNGHIAVWKSAFAMANAHLLLERVS